MPLIVSDRVVGVMDLESERIAYFTEEHVRTLTLLAPQIASSIENARLYEELAQREQRMEQDLKAARRVQSILLPREAPEMEGLDMAIGWRPAREISGDLFDFFELSEETIVIAFGDSSGKGAAAALYGSLVSGLLRSLAPRSQQSVRTDEAPERNSAGAQSRRPVCHADADVLEYEDARIDSVQCRRAATDDLPRGERMKVTAEGIPLGLLEDREYDEVTLKTKKGDTILLFSDGVADQLNRQERGVRDGAFVQSAERVGTACPHSISSPQFSEISMSTWMADR